MHFGLLGALEVTLDGRPLEIARPKQRAVLAELLIHANCVVSLDRFAEVLWPAEHGASTGSLPVYIANLRRLLEPDRPARTPSQRILTRAPGYLLRVVPGEYDVADFEALAAEGNRHLAEGRPRAARKALGDALSLWRGRAMEEFPFAELEAGRLEALRVAATEDRLEVDLALGAHTAVVAELERLVQEHGLRERLVGLLMLALYRSGRQGEALRACAAARDLLREELGIEPGPDLRRLEADILVQSPALDWRLPAPEGVAPEAPTQAPPVTARSEMFVGRAAELAVIEGALDCREDASGAIVLVAGEPGIGKTRLVQEAVSRATGRGCVVAWGRCDEGDGAPPFWPWLQVIRSLLDHPDRDVVRSALAPHAPEIGQLVPEIKELAGHVPPPAPLDPASARHRFFDAVAGFLNRLSQHQPVAVVLDDLHWADPPSLQLTGHLAGRLPGLRTRLIVTYRDVDPAPGAGMRDLLASLARQPGRRELSLQGLTRDEVARFVAHEVGADPPPAVLATVWDRTGGNPFFVGELTRLLVAEKALTEGTATTAPVPWAVRQVVGRRMERLPEATRELLVVAAVAGRDFDLRVAARAAHLDLDEALDVVDVAVAAGVVKEHPAAVERFQFSHALVQQTIYEELTGLRRARLHGLVAEALEETDGDRAQATEVAHHLYEAVAVAGPERAIAAAGRAAAAAQAALAYEVAENHLRRALALVEILDGCERDRLELDVQVQLATLLTMVKGIAVPETVQAWRRATELCQATEDQRRLLLSLWGLLTFAWANGDMGGAQTLAEQILHLRRTSSDPAITATAHLALGLVALCRGDVSEGSAHLLAGKEAADAAPEEVLAGVTFADVRVQMDSWLSVARHLEGEHEEGRRLVDTAVQRAYATGGPFDIATGLTFAVCSRVLSGDVGEAQGLAEELIGQMERHQFADFTYHGRVVRAWALAHGESPEQDVAALLEALPPATTAGIRPWHPFWLALTAEAWQRLSRLDEARRCVDEALGEIEVMGTSFSVAELLRLRGELLVALEPDRTADARADFEEAVRQADGQGATVYRDRARASALHLEDRLVRDPPSPGPRTNHSIGPGTA